MSGITVKPVSASGSTNGRPIQVSATSSPGDLLHAVSSTSGEWDEVWVWVSNTSSSQRTISLELGGTSANDLWVANIPPNRADVLVLKGHRFPGAASLNIRAFVDSGTDLNVRVNVNRITEDA